MAGVVAADVLVLIADTHGAEELRDGAPSLHRGLQQVEIPGRPFL
jgi:hypothetical protein